MFSKINVLKILAKAGKKIALIFKSSFALIGNNYTKDYILHGSLTRRWSKSSSFQKESHILKTTVTAVAGLQGCNFKRNTSESNFKAANQNIL